MKTIKILVCLSLLNSTIHAQNKNANSNIKMNKIAAGSNNYFAGLIAGSGNSGSYCTGVGEASLSGSNSGSYNTAFGYATSVWNSTGTRNTSIGYRALDYNKIGNDNTGSGFQALYNTLGSYNTAHGSNSLYSNTDGNNNTAIGYASLYSNTTGFGNTASGYKSLFLNSVGFSNTAYGYNSLYNNTSGYDNVALGQQSLYANTTGYFNTGVGDYALAANKTGKNNTVVGYNTLYKNTAGSNNVAVGYSAGYDMASNSYCTYIGVYADASLNKITNATAVGYSAKVNASNKVVIGNASVSVIGGQVNWSILSDGRFKKDIQQNVPGLSFINKLNPVTYHINQEKLERFLGRNDSIVQSMKPDFAASDKKLRTGLIAQEVEKAAQEINYDFDGVNAPQNEKDNYSLAYADFVPSLVKAVQELSKQNDELKKEVDALKIMMISNQSSSNSQHSTVLTSASLQQNIPNPFINSTVINYTLPSTYTLAKIIITDKNGKPLKEANISGSGNGSLKIDAALLTTGAYQYTLYLNNKLIDTKQMLLSK
jgi:hypothetical protein